MNKPKNTNKGNSATNEAGPVVALLVDGVALVKVVSLCLNDYGLSDEKSEYDTISVIIDYLALFKVS